MSDDLVALVNRLRANPTYDDISDGADLIDHQQERIEAQAKRIKELEYFMKWLASVQNGSFYVDDQEYQVTFTKTNGEPK